MSKCGRCLKPMLDLSPEEMADFLCHDHLCLSCRTESDSEHAQKVVMTERQSTVPGGAV